MLMKLNQIHWLILDFLLGPFDLVQLKKSNACGLLLFTKVTQIQKLKHGKQQVMYCHVLSFLHGLM